MKKLLVVALGLLCAAAITVQAQDAAPKKAKKALTAEQQKVKDELLAKYDTNKDGKLDKAEKEAMSGEDKAAWGKLYPPKAKKNADAAPAADAPKADAAK